MPRYFPLYLAIVLIFSSLIIFIFFGPFFKISQIQVTSGQDCLGETEIMSSLNISGKNIFLASTKKLESQLKDKYSCITKVTITKKLPNGLILDVIPQTSIVRIEGTSLAVTKQGLVKEGSDSKSLPTLFLPQDQKVMAGQKITDQTTQAAIEIADNLSKSDFLPTNIRLVSDKLIAVYNQEGVVVIFSASKDSSEQVDSLQQVLAKAKMESVKIIKIDLTFNKPVIVYK